ncbi:MAG: 50S ribosomal protein L28 [Dehalococcoidia bacterium]|nr:50S ribosomal protein L28 [Dehalococcoidia bacterium]
MAKCDVCGKGTGFGRNVSHSNIHTSRTVKANVQRAALVVNGKTKQMNVCTRCLRTRAKVLA